MARSRDLPVRVVICDDNAAVRTTLIRALEYREQLEIVGQYADVQDFLDHVEDAAPDVVVLDVNLPGMTGVEGVRALRARGLAVPVILMSADNRNAQLAADQGAGFFYKGTADLDELVREILDAAG